jgi:hypothetical protein
MKPEKPCNSAQINCRVSLAGTHLSLNASNG